MSDTPRDDGGPAFPWGEHGTHLGGMTLRDYFAAKALRGIMARVWCDEKGNEPPNLVESWAAGAYAIADAMLKERAR